MNNAHKNARTTPHIREAIVRRMTLRGMDGVGRCGSHRGQRTEGLQVAGTLASGGGGWPSQSPGPSAGGGQQTVQVLGEDDRGIAPQLPPDRGGDRRPPEDRALHGGRAPGLARDRPAGEAGGAPPTGRCHWERPGDLIHLDIKKLARFERVGHRITGDRRNAADGAGWEFVHGSVDDASRLAFVEVLADEKRGSTAGFLIRTLRSLRQRGIRVYRVNGSGYVWRLSAKVCRWLGLYHICIRPYTPRTNGKAERFI